MSVMPERPAVLYAVAVLSLHLSRLSGEAASASAERAVHLRQRAAQIDGVIAWLLVGEEQL